MVYIPNAELSVPGQVSNSGENDSVEPAQGFGSKQHAMFRDQAMQYNLEGRKENILPPSVSTVYREGHMRYMSMSGT